MTEDQKLDYEHRLTETADRSRSNTKRIDELTEMLSENNKLIGAIKELTVETRYMRENLNEALKRLDKLETKGGDKWDKFKWLIVTSLVTLILGYLAGQIGLSS